MKLVFGRFKPRLKFIKFRQRLLYLLKIKLTCLTSSNKKLDYYSEPLQERSGESWIENSRVNQENSSSPESVLFDTSIDNQFIKFKPFKHKFENKKVKESKTVKSKKSETKPKDDLNYFDELNFGDALRQFSPESVNTPRTVEPSPISLLELDRTDMHEIDQQYIVPGDQTLNLAEVSPASSPETNYPPQITSIPKDLGKFLDQYLNHL